MRFPETLWWLSTVLWRRGFRLPAKVIKGTIFVIFGACLPPEAVVARDVRLWHHGLGVVIHPNVLIEQGVSIGHQVTIAGTDDGPTRIGTGCTIGAKATILPRAGQPAQVGAGSYVGANSVVVGDVDPATTVIGAPARVRKSFGASRGAISGER